MYVYTHPQISIKGAHQTKLYQNTKLSLVDVWRNILKEWDWYIVMYLTMISLKECHIQALELCKYRKDFRVHINIGTIRNID